MADYKAPLRDMRFVLNEVFEVAKLLRWPRLSMLKRSKPFLKKPARSPAKASRP